MKKVKTLLAVGLASMILAGCGNEAEEHQHTFASEWSTSETQHWHAATCEHTDQKSELGNHVDANKDNKCDVCDYNMGTPTPSKDKIKNVTGGTEDERKSIQTCASRSIVMLDGSASIAMGNTTDLLEDSGNYVLLTTSQTITTNKVKYTVNLEWDVDESAYFEEFSEKDATHKILLIKYPGMEGTEGSLKLNLKRVSCGGASSDNTEVSYNFNIKKATYVHADAKLVDLNKVIAGPIETKSAGTLDAGYELVDYTKDNPYFGTNNPGKEKEYYYVNAAGKFIYNAPDGNWGLIADGDQIMEVYAGSAYNILPAYYPAMKNNYVKVIANMGQYQGNIQLGFVTNMVKATVADLDAEPTGVYHSIDDEFINKIKTTGGHKQCVVGENLTNSLRQLTGKLVPGSLELSEGQTEISSSKRFSFKMNIGENEVKVAYDYHTDKEASVGLFNKIKALLEDGGSTSYTIKGTLRYNCDDSNPFTATGEWELVPFLADHVA